MKTFFICAVLFFFSAVSVQAFTVLGLTEPIPEPDAWFGYSVSSADVNGDGFSDVIVGVRLATVDAFSRAGEAFLFLGPDLTTVVPLPDPAPEYQGNFGFSVSGAGDLNADGFEDVIVGAPGYGGVSAPPSRAIVFLGPDANSVIPLFQPIPDTGAHFGISVSGAGDVNGDGFDDAIVGASSAHPWGINTAGEAFLYFGPDLDSMITLTEPSPEEDAIFGVSVSGAGDVNGDGFDDVIVGAGYADPGGILRAGEAFVFLGPALDSVILMTEPTPERIAFFGYSVSGAGDVNKDGFRDVIVGAWGADSGRITSAGEAFVFLGPVLDIVIPLTEPIPEDSAQFGWSVSGAGDVNGDDFDDVIIGAYRADVGGLLRAGKAFLYLGPDLDSIIHLTEPILEDSVAFGFSVSGAGDVDGDGLSDLVVGAIRGDLPGAQEAGEAFVFLTDAPGVARDGGVLSLDAPPDTVFVDSSYKVMATVLNFGNVSLTFDVVGVIDGYADTVRVSGLAPDSSIQVTFKDWMVPSTDSVTYTMTVCTHVVNDADSTNDCGEKSIFAYNPLGVEESSTLDIRDLRFKLLQNEPNPFGGGTVIGYSLPATGAVTLEVYDMTGRLVKTLVDEHQKSGLYQVRWDAQGQASGIYFYRLQAGGFTATRKMTLLR